MLRVFLGRSAWRLGCCNATPRTGVIFHWLSLLHFTSTTKKKKERKTRQKKYEKQVYRIENYGRMLYSESLFSKICWVSFARIKWLKKWVTSKCFFSNTSSPVIFSGVARAIPKDKHYMAHQSASARQQVYKE